jgi:nucleoside-diphosphate-sugar epimerase
VKRVLVTGATGFVGREVCARLAARGVAVRAAVRTPGSGAADEVRVGEIDDSTDWRAALEGVDAVIHLAARVHMMGAAEQAQIAEYRRVNVGGTESLARQAAAAEVRRLVYASSIKVNGEGTHDVPYRPTDPPHPVDAYGISKWEAEEALWRVCAASGLEGVVVRPPLVYGPGVRANFLQLLKLVERGIPLPLGAVKNRRSLVFVGNLADALIRAAEHPAAAGRTYLVSDGAALSTADLVRGIATALARPARLVPIPPALLRLGGRVAGRGDVVERLCGSLEVDSAALASELGWTPPVAPLEGLRLTAEWFRGAARSAR